MKKTKNTVIFNKKKGFKDFFIPIKIEKGFKDFKF